MLLEILFFIHNSVLIQMKLGGIILEYHLQQQPFIWSLTNPIDCIKA